MKAVQDDGLWLQHCCDNQSADPDVVRAACAQNGLALKFAAAPLRASEEVLLLTLGTLLQRPDPGLWDPIREFISTDH